MTSQQPGPTLSERILTDGAAECMHLLCSAAAAEADAAARSGISIRHLPSGSAKQVDPDDEVAVADLPAAVPFVCPTCGLRFSLRRLLGHHLRWAHSQLPIQRHLLRQGKSLCVLRRTEFHSKPRLLKHVGASSRCLDGLQCSRTGFEKPREIALELVYRAVNRCKSMGARAGGLFQAFMGPIWARKSPKT